MKKRKKHTHVSGGWVAPYTSSLMQPGQFGDPSWTSQSDSADSGAGEGGGDSGGTAGA